MNFNWTKYLLGGLTIIFRSNSTQHLSLWEYSSMRYYFLVWTIPLLKKTEAIYIYGSLALLQDALYDSWGLMLFSKTLIVLLYYNFMLERNQGNIFSSQFAVFTLIIALTHNTSYYLLSMRAGSYASGLWPFTLVMLRAVYTALLSYALHKIAKS